MIKMPSGERKLQDIIINERIYKRFYAGRQNCIAYGHTDLVLGTSQDLTDL